MDVFKIERTFTTDGYEFGSTLTDEEAANLCLNSRNGFNMSLGRQFTAWGLRSKDNPEGITENQRAWMHRKALEVQKKAVVFVPAPSPPPLPEFKVGDLSEALALLEHAQNKKEPGFYLFQESLALRLYRDRDDPDIIRVKGQVPESGGWNHFGQISPLGMFRPTSQAPLAAVMVFLTGFAASPREVLIASGKFSGRCGFCGRVLTDEESNYRGYGPDCARQTGLPYNRSAANRTYAVGTEVLAANV